MANPYGGYYNPYSTYGGDAYGYTTPGAFSSSPLGNQYLEDNHDAAFTRALANWGYAPNTNQGEWGRNQFGRIDDAYKAALGTNPFLTFQNYLSGVNGNLQNQWAGMTYQQRGENPGQFGIRSRTIPR